MKTKTFPQQLLIIPVLFLLGLTGNSQVLSESFDAPTFPPTDWINIHTTGANALAVWERATAGALGGDVNATPFFVDPHSGAGMAAFGSYNFPDGNSAFLASRAVNLAGKGPQIVTFWMYRDDGYTAADSVSVYINTVQQLVGAGFLGKVQRYIGNAPAESGAAGWYKYSFAIPQNYNTAANYIVFNAVSSFGNNMFIDDVTVEDNPVALCSGTPVAGTISGAANVCAGTPFTLTNQGATDVPGINHAWQSAASSSGPWTNIPGQTGFAEAAGLTQTTTTWYRLADTCSASGLSSISNVFPVAMNAQEQCYCKPPAVTLHTLVEDNISNVTITGTSLNASNGTDAITGYTQVSPTPASNTANLQPATVYNITATVINDPEQVAVWVDVDRNGTFDAGEYFNLTLSGNTATGSIAVPADAVAGLTGLRIRARFTPFTSTDACSSFGSGETEDYVVNISGVTYTFTGTGNWSQASNWSNNSIPPATLPASSSIVIDHEVGGQCVLNVPQTVAAGATLTVLTGKNLIIAGQLSIQ
jgi:GEVED domain